MEQNSQTRRRDASTRPLETCGTCIVGAGWSGLLACKYFKEAGLDPIVLERNPYIGGVWRHDPKSSAGGVIKSTFTTSSKTTTEQSDFPMPGRFPDFPRHEQIMEYLRAYCDAFDLGPHVRLGDGVARARRDGDGWLVETERGARYRCERLVVCAGVHQEAAHSGRAQFANFSGDVMHSTQLEQCASALIDKRVLIIGSGETASDIAGEITRLTPYLSLSSPNGQWIVNRVSNLASARPITLDQHSSPLRELLDPTDASFYTAEIVETFYGRCGSGVPEWQTEKLYQSQFLNKNASIVDLWRTGQLRAKPRVERVDGAAVYFRDGTRDEFDVVVLCTGFDTVFPFLPAPYDTRPIDDHFKLILADDPSLSFVGFARPIVGSIPTIAEMQARCLAAMYAGELPVPGNRAAVIARDKRAATARYNSKRLRGLVDMLIYVRELAVWRGVEPDYGRLALTRPRDLWTLVSSPYNGCRYRLGDQERYAEYVAHLNDMRHPSLDNLSYWAHMLFSSALPGNADRVYHRVRFLRLRALLRLLLMPIYFPAMALSSREPSALTNLYGALVMLPLAPVVVFRLLRNKRRLKAIRAQFAPADPSA